MLTNFPQLIRLTVLLGLMSALLGNGFGCEQDKSSTQDRDILWDQVLMEFLSGTNADRVHIEKVLDAEGNSPLSDLCRVLLEEWDRPRTDQEFENPRIVFVPTPLRLSPRTPTPTQALLLELRVSDSGKVEEVRVLKGIFSTPELKELGKESMSQALFRPAIVNGRYVESVVTRMFRVDTQ